MESGNLLRLLPTLPMLAQELSVSGWDCRLHLRDPDQQYRGIRLYHGQKELRKDTLYLLRPGESAFPVDDHAYVASADLPGQANHLHFPNLPDEQILDHLMEIFSKFQEWEQTVDQLLYHNASLQELCELGAEILENPICIHDDWFIMTAMSQGVAEVMEPEYLMSSVKGFVPRAIVEDFKYDSDYLETYSHRSAQIWSPPDQTQTSLYVNLWEGTIYRGRLLVLRRNREFRRGDFLIAEFLTQRAILLMKNKQRGEQTLYQSMDDIVFAILQGQNPEPADQAQLLNLLEWNKNDGFLCIRIKNQQENVTSVMEHVLHGDLFRVFPGSYIMLTNHEQCLVLNLTKGPAGMAHIRHLLSPLCRDYCLYAGISSPVVGIRELNSAYYQAGAALDRAFRLRSDKWILCFSDCALDHVLNTLPPPLTPGHLVSPELKVLMDYDKEKGTAYFETLRAYLLQERDIPGTSEALIIHRTTLLYRLKKIQSLIHVDLEDPWQRLYLTLSLWILEKEKTGI